MSSQFNSDSQREVKANLLRWIKLIAPALVALVAAALFTVNDTDTLALRNGGLQILTNNSPYILVEGSKSPFTSPPHIALLGLPFVIAGARWSAFWNVFFALPVIVHGKNGLPAFGAKLLFIFTPPFLYMLASANITGTVTGIGLLLLLAHARGPARGIAWAFLLLRPQDSWAFLIYDGIRALRNRDYAAFITAALILLAPVLFTPTVYERWLTAMYYPLFINSLPGYTLSLAGTHGPMMAGLFIGIVGLLRGFTFQVGQGLKRRHFETYSEAEAFWLLAVITLTGGSYTSYYMLWLAFLIVRDYGLICTLTLLSITMVVGVTLMTTPKPEQIQAAMLILILIMAVISPRVGPQAAAVVEKTNAQNGSSSPGSLPLRLGLRRRMSRLL